MVRKASRRECCRLLIQRGQELQKTLVSKVQSADQSRPNAAWRWQFENRTRAVGLCIQTAKSANN